MGLPKKKRLSEAVALACGLGAKCRATARAKQLREYRRGIFPRQICGTAFKPKRADSLYCSPACKQKAHRNKPRQADSRPLKVLAPKPVRIHFFLAAKGSYWLAL
jgi:hypothetical protein